jgi:hypothetical protein
VKTSSSEDMIGALKDLTEVESGSELAKVLNVDKQAVYQYKQKSSEDIQQKIITLLVAKINSKA